MTSLIRVLLVAVTSTLLVAACSELPIPATGTEDLTLPVAPIPSNIPPYDRGDWRHWTDEDSDCQDTRQEVLIQESVSPVEYNDDRCRVESGEWNGPYTGEQFTRPRDLDVDHMVPLANAHRSGGWTWSEDDKRRYANDLSYDGHLIAVQNSANRAKGADGPEEWRPPDQGYWCQYAIDWVRIKQTWKLTATDAEASALSEMLNTCSPRRTLGTFRYAPRNAALPATPTPSQMPTLASEAVYDSCDAAEAAGEMRVRGSSGEGRGFPSSMVPSARDGDGDGVVCER